MNLVFLFLVNNLYLVVYICFGIEIDVLDVKILLILMIFCDVFFIMIFIYDCFLRCYIILLFR